MQSPASAFVALVQNTVEGVGSILLSDVEGLANIFTLRHFAGALKSKSSA
jgi:hypothetical protein